MMLYLLKCRTETQLPIKKYNTGTINKIPIQTRHVRKA